MFEHHVPGLYHSQTTTDTENEKHDDTRNSKSNRKRAQKI